ncbi:MAG: DUF4837 family protein [Prevotella sp.]
MRLRCFSHCLLQALSVISIAVMMAGCGDGVKIKPRSSGEACSVVVTGSDSRACAMVARMLEVEEPGLPQPENAFDVMIAGDDGQLRKSRYARAMVVVTVDGNNATSTRIRYEKDVFAEPQMIIYLKTDSADSLASDHKRVGRSLLSLLRRFETNVSLRRLRKSHSPAREKEVEKAVGCRMLVPSDITKSKTGRNFIWLSDDGSTAMRNICVYSVDGTDLSRERLLSARDSVMRVNIKGETDDMYMTTYRRRASSGADDTPTFRTLREGGREIVEMRGLWQMEGDAMGGPFVSHALIDSARGRTLVAETFVYAPGEKKRNIIKRMEAVLYTLSPMR